MPPVHPAACAFPGVRVAACRMDDEDFRSHNGGITWHAP